MRTRTLIFLILVILSFQSGHSEDQKVKNCINGNTDDCVDAGLLKSLTKDYEAALIYFQKACDAKKSDGCVFAGLIHHNDEKNGAKGSLKALELHEQACEYKNAKGCLFAGLGHSSHKYVPRNFPKALHFYKLGCEGKDQEACYNIGVFYETGKEGIEKNTNKAIEAYQTACQYNYKNGCIRASMLKTVHNQKQP